MEVCVYHTLDAIQEINRKMPEVTLRDLFAMNVLQAILPTPYGQSAENKNVAASAYAIADAMLEARRKK